MAGPTLGPSSTPTHGEQCIPLFFVVPALDSRCIRGARNLIGICTRSPYARTHDPVPNSNAHRIPYRSDCLHGVLLMEMKCLRVVAMLFWRWPPYLVLLLVSISVAPTTLAPTPGPTGQTAQPVAAAFALLLLCGPSLNLCFIGVFVADCAVSPTTVSPTTTPTGQCSLCVTS